MPYPIAINYGLYFLIGLIYAETLSLFNTHLRKGKWKFSTKTYVSMVILWPLGVFLILFHFLIGVFDGIVLGIKRWGDQDK